MKREEFLNLKRGDIVQNIGSGDSFVIETVTQHNGSFQFLGVRTCLITNPAEWEGIEPTSPPPPEFKIASLVKCGTSVCLVVDNQKPMLTVQDAKGNQYLWDRSACTPVRQVVKPFNLEEAIKAIATHGLHIGPDGGPFAKIKIIEDREIVIETGRNHRQRWYYAEITSWKFQTDLSPFGIVTYEDIT